MNHISKQDGKFLFERIEEVLQNGGLSPKERIPKYRAILEELFKLLTSDVNRYIKGLFAKTSFVFQEYAVPSAVKDHVHELRKYANTVVHNANAAPSELDDYRCLYQLSEALRYFAQIEAPADIKAVYQPHRRHFVSTKGVRWTSLPSYTFFAVVEDVVLSDGEMAGKFCTLLCSTDELGQIKLKLWNNRKESRFGSDLARFGKMVEPFQNIYVTEVKKYQNKEDEYYATDQSLLVLEPDYLIDAKDLSECRQRDGDNSLLYTLNRFTKGEVTDRVMVGNIVGKMLDDIATDPDYSFKKSFESVMRENSFGMLCMANQRGAYDRSTIEKVFVEANDQERTLVKTIQSFRGKQLIIEPTFISNKYGLQGRLDLLIDDQASGNRKDIVELKSSRSYPRQDIGLYNNHEAQTMCYDLLLGSTFPDRIGHSSILYASAPIEDMPLRHVDTGKYLSKQELLMIRNEIVATELKLARGEFQPLFDILAEGFSPVPKYQEEQLADFKATIHGLDPLLKKYFLGYLQFIYRELQVAKVGSNDGYNASNGFADLWKSSKAEKLDNYNVLVYLEVQEFSNDYHITLKASGGIFSADICALRAGEMAVLYPTPEPEILNPLNSQILKCYIRSIDDQSVTISLVNKQLDKDYFKKFQFWALERDFRDSSYKRMLQLHYAFLKTDERRRNLILGLERPEFESRAEIPIGDLNDIQHELVSRALSAEDYFLIQGPPGTGKTSRVLCEIVKHIEASGKNVMVIAFTNRAVDEISEKLVGMGINCIRLGKGDESYYWSALSSKLHLKELYDKVGETQVFLSTQATFSNSLDLLKFKEFDTLIVDEASQLLEPQLTGLLKHFRRWIFIGDENQLPAVVLQSEKDSVCNIPELNALDLKDYRESLFSRLKHNAIKNNWKECYGTLTTHYRMHVDIADFPNEHFYNSVLRPGTSVQEASIPYYSISDEIFNSLFSKARVIFIPTRRDLRSKVNEEEANLIKEIIPVIQEIYGESYDPSDTVGVITPFRAQIANIKKELGKQYREVTVDTVERYQGSERDIIILSFAIKSSAQLGAIQSIYLDGVDRKLNVALTRAKKHLILLGTEEYLEKNYIFKNLIQFIKENGGYMVNPLKAKSIPTDLF